MIKLNQLLLGLLFLSMAVIVSSCGDDDDDDDDDMAPAEENEEEVITTVTLTFTPDGGGTAITAIANDPDGEGPEELEITQDIELAANTTYALSMELLNEEDLADVEDITEEIEEEDDEHMFFFAWTDGVFSDPAGDGNADSRDDTAVNYDDEDGDGLPLGLATTWTTGDASTGTFRVVLKHQPPTADGDAVKTATSTINDGDTDIDLTFDITVQ